MHVDVRVFTLLRTGSIATVLLLWFEPGHAVKRWTARREDMGVTAIFRLGTANDQSVQKNKIRAWSHDEAKWIGSRVSRSVGKGLKRCKVKKMVNSTFYFSRSTARGGISTQNHEANAMLRVLQLRALGVCFDVNVVACSCMRCWCSVRVLTFLRHSFSMSLSVVSAMGSILHGLWYSSALPVWLLSRIREALALSLSLS